MRRQALGCGLPAVSSTATIHDHAVLRPRRRADARRRPACSRRARGATGCSRCAREPPRRRLPAGRRASSTGAIEQLHDPGHDGRRRRARAQPAARRDGRHRRPAADASASSPSASTRSSTRSTSCPRKVGKLHAAAAAAEAAQGGDLLHRRLQRAARARSTRRSPARAAWAATSTSARRRGRTGATSSTSTSSKVAHDAGARHADERRDELARITNGYSPAMIDQVCSMALTYAHSDGRASASSWRRHRRGDDDRRGRRRDRPALPASTRSARPRSTRPATPSARHLYMREPAVDAALDPQARLLRRPPPGDGDRGALRATGARRRSAT